MGSDQANSEMAKDSIFTCHIRTDEKPSNDLNAEMGCDYFYCTDCISKYISSRLEDRVAAIKCPVPSWVPTFPKKYLTSGLIFYVTRWCWHLRKCTALLRIVQGCWLMKKLSFFLSECPYCNSLFCAQCQVPWHSGIVCAEFQKLNKDERSHEDILLMSVADRGKWRGCSKCGFYVERTDGCLFMKCRCGHPFCYNCGAPLSDHYCKTCKR